MKKFLTIAVSSALLIAASIAIAAVPDFTMYGFPNVVATVIIQPDQNAVLTLGNASINIPAGTFGNVFRLNSNCLLQPRLHGKSMFHQIRKCFMPLLSKLQTLQRVL